MTGTEICAAARIINPHLQLRDVWHLLRPLVIWPGATLTLTPGEVLEMDTAVGAFVLGFGALRIDGAVVQASAGRNPGVPGFRPFVLVTGQGTLQAHDATFRALGFHGPVAFRGVSVLSGDVMKPDAAPQVTASRFVDVGALSLEGADGAVIRGNRFDAAPGTALSIKGGRGILVADNRISGTAHGAGLRLSGVVADITVTGNLVTGGGRNGMQFDGATQGLMLAANVVTGNAGTGVTISRGTCLTIRGNILADNGATGLRLSHSGDARLTGNAIFGNGSAGVELLAQTGLPPIVLERNALRRNRDGLRAAGLGTVELRANELSLQMPRQFAGDFAPWLAAYLADAGAFVIPAAAGPSPAPAAPCRAE